MLDGTLVAGQSLVRFEGERGLGLKGFVMGTVRVEVPDDSTARESVRVGLADTMTGGTRGFASEEFARISGLLPLFSRGCVGR
jgi:hypothetical protein